MKILFLCVANSARSQMAEGLARLQLGSRAVIVSAGSKPTQVNPFAVRAMSKIGVDLSTHCSKSIEEALTPDVDLVITLCADEVCPVVPPGVKKLHWPFEDPADAKGDEKTILASFENIRDQISAKLIAFAKETGL